MTSICERVRRAWAALIDVPPEPTILEKIMLQFDNLTAAVDRVVAEVADLKSHSDAGDQATIDALTAKLNSALDDTPAPAPTDQGMLA